MLVKYLDINEENSLFYFLICVKHLKILLKCNCLLGKHHCFKKAIETCMFYFIILKEALNDSEGYMFKM